MSRTNVIVPVEIRIHVNGLFKRSRYLIVALKENPLQCVSILAACLWIEKIVLRVLKRQWSGSVGNSFFFLIL